MSIIQSLDRGLMILQDSGGVETACLLWASSRKSSRLIAAVLSGWLKRYAVGVSSLPHPAARNNVLGSSMWTLSRQYDWGSMLVRVAHKPLKELASGINETAHLAIREGKNALFIDSADTTHVIAVAGQTGELVPLYCTAHGKALLADATERDLRLAFGAGPLEKHTSSTITAVPLLARECAAIKARATLPTRLSSGKACAASRLPSAPWTAVSSRPSEYLRRRAASLKNTTRSTRAKSSVSPP